VKTLVSRIALVSLIASVLLVPLYAHHASQFFSKAMELNATEVRIGELAMNMSQNPQVKEFAQMMVTDHNEGLTKTSEMLDARAAMEGMDRTKIGPNTKNAKDIKLTAQHQQLYDRLSKLSGADFDREFIAAMVTGHRDAIVMFEAQSRAHGNSPTSSTHTTMPSSQQTMRQKPTDPDQGKYSRADLQMDRDSADYARDTLPTLRSHLQQAEAIQKQLQVKKP
jgi:putative membrane protein